MKKIITLTIVLGILLSFFSVQSMALDIEEIESEVKTIELRKITNIQKGEQSYSKVFDDNTKTSEFDLKYNVKNDLNEDDIEILYFSGELSSNGKVFQVESSGVNEIYQISDGQNVTSAFLEGFMTNEDTRIRILMSYETLQEEEFISITLVLEDSQPVLIFGENIFSEKITKELNEILKSEESKIIESNEVSELENSKSNIWKFAGSATENTSYGSASNKAVYAQIFYGSEEYVLKVDIKSYMQDIQDMISEQNPYHNSTILMSVKSSVDFKQGSCCNLYPEEANNGHSVYWKTVFLDILNHFKVPTWTLDAIFSSSKGGINADKRMYNPSIEITGTSLGTINCDTAKMSHFYGVSPTTTDKSSGEFSVTVVYRINDTYDSYYIEKTCTNDYSVQW